VTHLKFSTPVAFPEREKTNAMAYIEMILNRVIVRTLTQELYRIYTFLMPTTFIWNNQRFSPQELVDLQEVPVFIVGIQKVVKFWLSEAEFLPMSTSGSTGVPKVWHHPRVRLAQSAQATLEHFGLAPGAVAVLGLPADRIGGAMMVIRALVGSLELHLVEPKITLDLPRTTIDFIPLTVPQFQHLSWQEGIKKVLLGGSAAPVAPSPEGTEVYVGYGMTETASHVAVRALEDEMYRAVGSTRFSVNMDGALVVRSPHLGIEELVTNDAAVIHNDRAFTIEGRLDFAINSGGIKIHPEHWEQALAAEGIRAAVAPLEDEVFGQLPVLILSNQGQIAQASALVKAWPKNQRPKHYLLLAEWPEVAGGKLDRRGLALWVKSHQDRLCPL
jgi:O-succinylbenzoic acid--CoA ligase